MNYTKMHIRLNALVANYIDDTKKGLIDSTILDLIEWSYQQSVKERKINP